MTPLITGANRGIGLAMLTAYASAGHRPLGTFRTSPPEGPEGAEWHCLDVSAPEAHAALAQSLEGRPIDVLVCNAGIYPDKGHELETGFPPEMWAETFATNVTGVFLTVRALLPNLRRAPAPKIAIISSQLGASAMADGGRYIYRASKAAATNLGRNLAADLARHNIAVGIYHPGWVRTEMGGALAEIAAEDAAAGLIARIEALNLASSGIFETWEGRLHPF